MWRAAAWGLALLSLTACAQPQGWSTAARPQTCHGLYAERPVRQDGPEVRAAWQARAQAMDCDMRAVAEDRRNMDRAMVEALLPLPREAGAVDPASLLNPNIFNETGPGL